jgi:hypothetical protein
MSKQQIIEFGKNHKGSILAYSLIILSMMIAIATAISVSTIIGKKGASGTEFSVQSLQTADSGVQTALKKINGGTGANLEKAINDSSNFGGTCSDAPGATITPQSITGGGTYDLKFYKEDGTTPVVCTDLAKNIGMIKSVGKFKDTVRAVSVAVASSVNEQTYSDAAAKGTLGDPICMNSDTMNLRETINMNQFCIEKGFKFGTAMAWTNTNGKCQSVDETGKWIEASAPGQKAVASKILCIKY